MTIPINKIANFKSVWPEKKPEVEYCEDYQSWGNMGDAYSHGYEIADYKAHNSALDEASKVSVEVDSEALRLFLIPLISELVFKWKDRPFSGKGSDRSDLVREMAEAISASAEKIIRLTKG